MLSALCQRFAAAAGTVLLFVLTGCAPPETASTGSAASPAAGGSPAAATTPLPAGGGGKTLTGAGATFPEPLYKRWFQVYGQQHGVQINYQAIGSGGGI